MRIVAMIQARMGSTRMPGKVLYTLPGSTTILGSVINAIRYQDVDEVVVLTTQDDTDNIIEAYVKRNWQSVEVYRKGLEPLKLSEWYYRAGEAYKADYILRVCGDSPLINPLCCAMLIAWCRSHPGRDYYQFSLHDGFPAICTWFGIFPEIFRYWALASAQDLRQHEIEHATPVFYTHPDRYRIESLPVDPDVEACPVKLSVDTLDVYEAVYELLDLSTMNYAKQLIPRHLVRAAAEFAALRTVARKDYEWLGDSWHE